jgi:hypothetical protein
MVKKEFPPEILHISLIFPGKDKEIHKNGGKGEEI